MSKHGAYKNPFYGSKGLAALLKPKKMKVPKEMTLSQQAYHNVGQFNHLKSPGKNS